MIKHIFIYFIFLFLGSILLSSNALAQTTTWNGTMWVGGTPNNTLDAVLAANYNAGSFDAKSITVNAGVTFSAIGFFTTVNNMTNNGTVIMGVQNIDVGANLINNGTIYNCAGGALNVTGTTSGAGNLYNMPATEPTDAGMGMFSFTGATATSVTITLSATGDGARRIMVLKENSAVAGGAVLDGAVYTANANFGGAGSPIDGGKVVYSGTGNSVTVTGLTNMTTYHVAVFEYNETGNCTNYKTDTFLSDSYFLNASASTTWNGTAWSNGTPNNVTNATIDGDYNTSTNGNFVCAQLTVNVGRTLTIHGTGTVQVNTSTVNNLGTINDCNTAPGLSGAMTIAPNAKNTPTFPMSEASGINFSNITTSSFDIAWLSGDGAKRVVVVKPTSAVDVNALTNGTVYTANTNFSMGTAIDMTAKVVYNNTGSSVSVTGLSAGTNYHVAIFEYNESVGCATSYKLGSPAASSQMTTAGAANSTWNGTMWDNGAPGGTTNAIINGNYNTGTNGNISALTLTINTSFTLTVTASGLLDIVGLTITNNGILDNCLQGTVNGTVGGTGTYKTVAAEPTTAASMLNFTAIGTNTFTINWNNGSGAKRLVVVKPNSAVATSAIVDGTAYTANANFAGGGSTVDGTGKVVYANNGNSVVVTGLSSGVTYHVAIFEYDENANCGANYKTNTILSGSQITNSTATTWNGTMWDNGAPNATVSAVIDGAYNTGTNGSITALSLTVNATRTLTLATAGSVVITNALTNNGTINNCEPRTLTFGSFAGNTVNIAATEPTTDATILLFTAVSATGFTINWVNGNGAKRIVVVKPTNAILNTAITDNTAYTADANFGGTGSIVDGTGKVVYANTGTSVAVTGLSANTTYHVSIFEYNETGCGGNYKTNTPLAGNRLTDGLPTTWNGSVWSNGAPAANIDAIIAGNYNTTSGNITAKNLTVNAGQTLSIHAAAASVSVNGNLTNNGTINNCFGGTITVTGSTTGNATQIAAIEPTTEATVLNFAGVISNSISVNFTNGNGAKRIIVLKQGSAVNVNALTDGTTYTADANFTGTGSVVDGTGKVVYNGINNNVTITQLLPNTNYHVAIFEFNETGCGANYKIGTPLSGNTTTLMATLTTWNGTTWDNGAPTVALDAVIAGNYTTANGNIAADNLTINAGATLTLHNASASVAATAIVNTGTINNCVNGNLTPAPGGTVFAPAAEPLTPASNITFSAITSTSFNINWTNGNGIGRIVIVQSETSSGGATLADGVTYTANPTFGQGSAVQGGHAVYIGNVGNATSVTGLTEGIRYQVLIYEYNNDVNCGNNYRQNNFANASQTTLQRLPAPVALPAKEIISEGFLANWEMPNNVVVASFELDIALDEAFTRLVSQGIKVSDLKYTVKGLLPITAYFYRVRAVTNIQLSANSNIIRVVTTPKAPKALDATNVVSGGFNANWEATAGADSYELQVASTLPDYQTIKVSGANTATFKVSGLPTESAFQRIENYFYRVRLITKDGIASEYSNLITVKTVPAAPVATNATNLKETSFSANWNEVRGADSYILETAEDKDFTLGLVSREVKGTTSSIINLKEGKTYFYRLKAKNTSGESGYSNVIEASTNPTAPTELRLVTITSTTINVAWTASKSELAVTYLVDVATDANFSSIIIRSQRASNLSAALQSASIIGGRDYYVRVRTVHSKDGLSDFSATLRVLAAPPAPRLSLVADKTTENSFDLSWTRIEAVSGYELDVATNANFTTIIANYNAKSINEIATSVTAVNSLTVYFCRVRAVNASGKSENSNVIEVATLPNPVQTRLVTDLTLTQFRANWDASTQANVNNYQLEISKNEAFTDLLSGFAPLEIFNNNNRLVDFPEGVRILYYRVKVKAVIGNNTVISRPSNVQRVSILDMPTGFRVTNLTSSSFRLDWNAVSGAEQYEVSLSIDNFRTTVANFSPVRTNTAGINLERLEANRMYQIRVRATATNAISDLGNTSQMTLAPLPEEMRIKRLATTRTTAIEILYYTLPVERLSNLRFVVERSDADGAAFRPISQTLQLADNRSLRYDDNTGSQRLQATYRIKITNAGGDVFYNIPNRIVTATEDGLFKDSVLLYPNPTSNTFQIKLPANYAKTSKVNIYDNMGRQVMFWDSILLNDYTEFDISKLSTGKYTIVINNEKQQIIRLSLIKE
jgi:hypothetical protein